MNNYTQIETNIWKISMNSYEKEIDECIDRFLENESYVDIRKNLQSKGLDEEAVSYIMRKLDEFVLEYDQNMEGIKNARMSMIMGAVVMIFGFGGFWYGINHQILYSWEYLLFLSPAFLGAYVIYRQYRKIKRLKEIAYRDEDIRFQSRINKGAK
ncbi:MAG TPA: hypothetical protein DDY13_01175 [Cytophagales bacterium]|nr:hypothetical protein [Cytophagales bacterium]